MIDPVIDEIRQILPTRDMLLFVGAGVSMAAGLPSWPRLVNDLIEHAKKRGAPGDFIAEATSLCHRSQLIDALSALESALGPNEFCNVVERRLDDSSRPIPELAIALAALIPYVRAVLTTNIDGILERAFGGAWPALHSVTGDIASRRQFILKLHGTLLDRRTWVFTRAQYDRAMYADPLHRAIFSALFHAYPILFIGFGLADEDLDIVLGHVRALSGSQAPRHYALVADDTITPYRRSKIESSGVRLIAYPNPDSTHGELLQFIRSLKHLGEPADRPVVSASFSSAAPSPAPEGRAVTQADIISQKAPFWEIRLLTLVLAEEIEKHRDLRRDITLGLSIATPTVLSKNLFARWARNHYLGFTRLTGAIDTLVNRALPDAMKGNGSGANPDEIIYAARRIGEVYKEMLTWALRWRRIQTDQRFENLVDVSARFANGVIEALETWGPRMAAQADTILMNYKEGDPVVFQTELVLASDQAEALQEELKRLAEPP